MKKLAVFLLSALMLAPLGYAQGDSTIHVNQFPGKDVGTKISNAMLSCPAAPTPCILLLDASLATAAAGTVPTLCGNCYLQDMRNGPIGTPGSSMTGLASVNAGSIGNTLYPQQCSTSFPPPWCGATANMSAWLNAAALYLETNFNGGNLEITNGTFALPTTVTLGRYYDQTASATIFGQCPGGHTCVQQPVVLKMRPGAGLQCTMTDGSVCIYASHASGLDCWSAPATLSGGLSCSVIATSTTNSAALFENNNSLQTGVILRNIYFQGATGATVGYQANLSGLDEDDDIEGDKFGCMNSIGLAINATSAAESTGPLTLKDIKTNPAGCSIASSGPSIFVGAQTTGLTPNVMTILFSGGGCQWTNSSSHACMLVSSNSPAGGNGVQVKIDGWYFEGDNSTTGAGLEVNGARVQLDDAFFGGSSTGPAVQLDSSTSNAALQLNSVGQNTGFSSTVSDLKDTKTIYDIWIPHLSIYSTGAGYLPFLGWGGRWYSSNPSNGEWGAAQLDCTGAVWGANTCALLGTEQSGGTVPAMYFGTNGAANVNLVAGGAIRWIINGTSYSLTANGAYAFSTDGGAATFGKVNQNATGEFAGTCAMSSSTSCTFTIAAAYGSTPICHAGVQGTTAIAGSCSVSGTTVTITAASSNSQTWGATLTGNPN